MAISRLTVATCLSASILVPQIADAAPSESEAEQASAGDIIVTARRTAERLQDVPVAVTAITGDLMEQRNMRTLADIQTTTPGLTLTSQNAVGGKAAVGLRGQRQFNSGISVDPSVAVYVNELYMARTSIDTALYDLESIQVLKGPQGTLFGRNSTGGAVLVSSKRPGDYFGGFVRGQLEDPLAYNFEAALNVPLGDGSALRLSGVRQYRRGYSDVLNFPGRADGRDRYGVRGSLKIQSGALSTLFVGDYYHWNENGNVFYPLFRNTNVTGTTATRPVYVLLDAALAEAAASDWIGNRTAKTNPRPASRGRNYSGVNITSYELGDITFKNIIGYAATRDNSTVDNDGTQAPVVASNTITGQKQFSEEFQIQGKSFDEALDWIAGAYYFRESGFDRGLGNTFQDPTTTIARTDTHSINVNSARSVFVHGSYLLPIAVPAHVFGGVRRGNDRREVTFLSGNITATGGFTCTVPGAPATLGAVGGACALEKKVSFNSTTWDVGFDIKPTEDLLMYASVSRGFRTGGFNGRAATAVAQAPFNPETVTNYEVGLKYSGDVGGMRTSLNIAAFHSKYGDIQQNVNFINPVNGALATSIINAAKARINGVEADFSLQPVEALTLSGFFSVTDAKYIKFEQATAGGGIQDLSANKFAVLPRATAGGSITWDVVSSESVGDLQLGVNMRYSDGYELAPINAVGHVTKSFDVWNAQLRLANAFGSKATLEVYAKNIFDKTYSTGGFSSIALGYAVQTLGDPRVIGIGIRLPFGGED